MTLLLECRKLKRTGIIPAFLAGGLLSAAVPIINMAARSSSYTSLSGDPLTILLDSNWQMMAMLNILTLICTSCMMYHSEYADNGIQKMDVLPVRPFGMFLGKAFITALSLAVMILLEMASFALCMDHWFSGPDASSAIFAIPGASGTDFPVSGVSDPGASFAGLAFSLLKAGGFQFLILLPTALLMLLIASACRNIWISLGIGVICVFALMILPQDSLILNLIPFHTPYLTFPAVLQEEQIALFLFACTAETLLFAFAESLFLKVRRCFS